ncbi:MAG: hypothetical protein QXP58_07025 [Thermoprotei archaeon]
MPKPRRLYVRVEGREVFLERMYYATGISKYDIWPTTVERYTRNIPLYSVERLQDILFGPWETPLSNYEYYFERPRFRRDYWHRVDHARLEVRDWRGIP